MSVILTRQAHDGGSVKLDGICKGPCIARALTEEPFLSLHILVFEARPTYHKASLEKLIRQALF